MSDVPSSRRPGEEELRRRISALGPEALAVLARQTGIFAAPDVPAPTHASKGGSVPGGAADLVPPPIPSVATIKERNGRVDPDDLAERDVEAMIEHFLQQGDASLDVLRSEVRSPDPPPAVRPTADGGEWFRRREEDAALAALYTLVEERRTVAGKERRAGGPRPAACRPLRNCMVDIVHLIGTAEMPPGNNGWADFLAAVPQIAARVTAENVSPSTVARVALLLLTAGVFAETETPVTTATRPHSHVAPAAGARPKG